MENLKIFFIALFTCSKRSEVRERIERKKIDKYYQLPIPTQSNQTNYYTLSNNGNNKPILPSYVYIDDD